MAVMAGEARLEVFYPDSDGEPMAENTVQYQYLVTIQVGLDAMFADSPDVFVAGDLFWYPVEGRPDIKTAPDVLVVFGRPRGHRGSYRQWEEGGIAPQVAFEIISPGNTASEMKTKRKFYQRHGVEEYYEYDPGSGTLEVWLRQGDFFRSTVIEHEWKSPRLGITLQLEETGELSVFDPQGRKFLRPVENVVRAEQAETRAEQAEARVALLAAKLRELGVDPEKLGDG
jgi:Uma2 family endonuclease